ncbi:lactate racemase domain-containing protein [Novipirellula aureliae]|nr:lactate racemase domain-containing protein [Novipirellula aureliae]
MSANRCPIKDFVGEVRSALRRPEDFPAVSAAIAPGDRVALAVDPNLPSLLEILGGVLSEMEEAGADAVDVVLWDEATDATIQELENEFKGRATILRHDSTNRESLRYLGADVDAEPVYLNRAIADADFVLPIVAARPWDAASNRHLSGVYPMLADANTRIRHLESLWKFSDSESKSGEKQRGQNEAQIGWMLGVQVMMAVAASEDGLAGSVFAGTPETIRRSFALARDRKDEYPPSAKLVIASLEGNQQQQTWANFARALMAAATHVAPGGTILVWTSIQRPPSDRLVYRLNQNESMDDHDSSKSFDQDAKSEDGFTIWDESVGLARILERVLAESRVLIKSQLDRDTVEALGFGVIDSLEGIEHLSRSFEDCETFRAAQFASGTFDSLGFDSLPSITKRSS